MNYQDFRRRLLAWAEQVERPLPWKGQRDPYLIWLSEVLLQQTRVAQGMPYYLRFMERFPDVHALAAAEPDEVMKLWEGLGYYSRARNLMQTARLVAADYGGEFPREYEALRKLPGIGSYTAAAIASFAFHAPHAVLDGNVFRVLSRFFGISEPIDTTEGRRRFENLAQEVLDKDNPAAYNQAIMDFGALCCTPRNPNCSTCPLQSDCSANRSGIVQQLPIKSRSLQKRDRFFHYFVIRQEGRVGIQRREGKDIWQHLYEFPMVELSQMEADPTLLASHPQWPLGLDAALWEICSISGTYKQTLTHQHICAVFFEIDAKPQFTSLSPILFMVEHEKLNNFAFPKLIDTFLNDQTLSLNLI